MFPDALSPIFRVDDTGHPTIPAGIVDIGKECSKRTWVMSGWFVRAVALPFTKEAQAMCPITLVEQHGQDHQIPTTRTPSQIPGAGDGALLDAAPTAQILDDRCNPSRRNRGVFGEPVRLARLDGRTKIRLSGVAAPETYERGGPEATSFMKMLVNGRNVDCDLDGTRTYDRLVGICYLDGSDIGEAVIAAGLARDCPRYSHGRYRSVEQPSAASLTFPRYCSRW